MVASLFFVLAWILPSVLTAPIASADNDPHVQWFKVSASYASGQWTGDFAGSLYRYKSGTYQLKGWMKGKCPHNEGSVKIEYGKTTESWKASPYKYCDKQERYFESSKLPIAKGDLVEIQMCVGGFFTTECGRRQAYNLW
jgi:hypothetical protein